MDMKKIQSENDKKKEYLWKYRNIGRKIKRIEAEVEEIRSMKMYPSMNNDGMPHGSNLSDLSDYAAQLTSLENQLCKDGVEQVRVYKAISFQINLVKDENERDVLFYRYIKGLSWWEIAKKMGYSERQIHRYHGKALASLKISAKKIKDVSECQSNM